MDATIKVGARARQTAWNRLVKQAARDAQRRQGFGPEACYWRERLFEGTGAWPTMAPESLAAWGRQALPFFNAPDSNRQLQWRARSPAQIHQERAQSKKAMRLMGEGLCLLQANPRLLLTLAEAMQSPAAAARHPEASLLASLMLAPPTRKLPGGKGEPKAWQKAFAESVSAKAEPAILTESFIAMLGVATEAAARPEQAEFCSRLADMLLRMIGNPNFCASLFSTPTSEQIKRDARYKALPVSPLGALLKPMLLFLDTAHKHAAPGLDSQAHRCMEALFGASAKSKKVPNHARTFHSGRQREISVLGQLTTLCYTHSDFAEATLAKTAQLAINAGHQYLPHELAEGLPSPTSLGARRFKELALMHHERKQLEASVAAVPSPEDLALSEPDEALPRARRL